MYILKEVRISVQIYDRSINRILADIYIERSGCILR